MEEKDIDAPAPAETEGTFARGLCRRMTEAERRDTAAQIRRILALPAPGESWDMLAEAGVPEEERDIRSAIIVRQAVRALDGDTRAATWLLKHGGDDPHYRIEMEKLRILRESSAAAKALEDGGHSEVVIYLPAKEADEEDGEDG